MCRVMATIREQGRKYTTAAPGWSTSAFLFSAWRNTMVRNSTTVSTRRISCMVMAFLQCSTVIMALMTSTLAQNAPLTQEQIIQMSKAGLPEDVIVARIKAEPESLKVSTDDLIKLKKAGVSDGVIRALVSPRSTQSSATAAVPAPSPTAPTSAPSATRPTEPDVAEKVYLLDSSDRSLKLLPEAPAKAVTHHKGITGAAGVIQIPGPTSSFRVKGGTDLEFVVKCTDPGAFELYAFPTKGENREAVVSKAKGHLLGGVSAQTAGLIPVQVSKYSDTSYRFVLKAPEPGEYGFAVGWSVFDFGVDSK
jgi:hypothetical protein